jgi:hypothetical protein
MRSQGGDSTLQKMGWLAEINACEQRKIARRLQQMEVLQDRRIAHLLRGELRIFGYLLAKRFLKRLLRLEKLIEQRQLRGRDGGAARVLRQQAVSMHRDKNRSVGIFGGDQAHGTVTHGEIIRKINFFKSQIFAD